MTKSLHILSVTLAHNQPSRLFISEIYLPLKGGEACCVGVLSNSQILVQETKNKNNTFSQSLEWRCYCWGQGIPERDGTVQIRTPHHVDFLGRNPTTSMALLASAVMEVQTSCCRRYAHAKFLIHFNKNKWRKHQLSFQFKAAWERPVFPLVRVLVLDACYFTTRVYKKKTQIEVSLICDSKHNCH